MKRFLSVLMGLLILVPAGRALSAEGAPEAEASVGLMSQYIFRGWELTRDSMVVEPKVAVSFMGVKGEILQFIDTDPYDPGEGRDNLLESDLTLSYATEIQGFDVEGGYIWYAIDEEEDLQELFVSATWKTFLNPTLTIYREFYHSPSTYITLGVSHSMALPYYGATLSMELSGSYLISNDSEAFPDPDDPEDEYSNFHDGLARVAVKVPVTRYVSVIPELDWSFPLCADAADDMQAVSRGRFGNSRSDNFIYGGLTLELNF